MCTTNLFFAVVTVRRFGDIQLLIIFSINVVCPSIYWPLTGASTDLVRDRLTALFTNSVPGGWCFREHSAATPRPTNNNMDTECTLNRAFKLSVAQLHIVLVLCNYLRNRFCFTICTQAEWRTPKTDRRPRFSVGVV